MKYPIFVPSKGRPSEKLSPLIALFLKTKIPFTIVLEPQDVNFYKYAFPYTPFLVLKENDQGIGFARQSILMHAKEKHLKAYWQMDDDIKGFCQRIGNKAFTSDPRTALIELERFFDEAENIFILSPMYDLMLFYRQYTKDFVYKNNGYCVTCCLTRPIDIEYDKNLQVWEDIDFQFKGILKGYNSFLLNTFMIKPNTGGFYNRNKVGGAADFYRAEKHNKLTPVLLERYKGYLSLDERKPESIKLKANWAKFQKI